jgi:hypothetical protein
MDTGLAVLAQTFNVGDFVIHGRCEGSLELHIAEVVYLNPRSHYVVVEWHPDCLYVLRKDLDIYAAGSKTEMLALYQSVKAMVEKRAKAIADHKAKCEAKTTQIAGDHAGAIWQALKQHQTRKATASCRPTMNATS